MTTATSNGYNQVERFKWAPLAGAPGEFQWIDKHLLHIDHTYQRNNVSNARVVRIARDWSWERCLALGVAKRPDQTHWVFDGQHRQLASLKREDIVSLPCLVFPFQDVSLEAGGFVGVNTVRGSVRAIEVFRGKLVAGDPDARFVTEMVEANGYKIGTASGCVRCVALLMSMVQTDSGLARDVFAAVVRLHDGASIHENILAGVFELERHLRRREETVLKGHLRDKLGRYRVSDILESIRKAKAYHNKGGQKVYAQGVMDLLNKGSSTRRLAPLLG